MQALKNVGPLTQNAMTPFTSIQPIRALVVDDLPEMRHLISTIFARESRIEVIGTASNGAEALAEIAAEQPDLVVMDISMPLMNGLEAAIQIRRRFPQTKIIIVSADCDQDLAEAAIDCGADAFIPKSDLMSEYKRQVCLLFPGDEQVA